MSGITEVIDNLYISGLESAAAILGKGIRCVINISSECPRQDLGSSVEYEKISIPDLPTTSIQIYFDRLADRIEQNLQQGKKTLVHCYVGRSRSASIILAYLMKHKKMSLRDAYYYLRSRRPIIGPNFGFIKQLTAYEKSLYGFTSVSFVDTAYDSIPDIYLSPGGVSSPRWQTPRIPMRIANKSFSSLSKPNSYIARSNSNHLPILSPRNLSTPINQRPVSSKNLVNSSFLQQYPNENRYDSIFEPAYDPLFSARLSALRLGKYLPPDFDRFYLP